MAWFLLLDQLWSTCAVPSEWQAMLLEGLAEQPALSFAGTMTDRVGRLGVAVQVESRQLEVRQRHLLLLDEATGALLAYEQIALDAQGWLPTPPPATTSYTSWLISGRVESTDDRAGPGGSG